MSYRTVKYRFYGGLLLVWIITSWATSILYAQNSEFDKLFKESVDQQYNNPNKSLDLFKFLLKTDLEENATFSVYLEQLHTYQILGQYVHAVETLEIIKEVVPSITNKELLFRYWLGNMHLYHKLNFLQEAEKSLLKAESLFQTLPSLQKSRNRKYLEYANFSLEKFNTNKEKIERLKTLRTFWNEKQAKYAWLSYKLGELSYELEKESSLSYFNNVIEMQNQLLSPIAKAHVKLLRDENINNFDSLNWILKDENVNNTLKISFLKKIIPYCEANAHQNKWMLFTDKLDDIKVENSLLNRQAKALLLENIYYNKRANETRKAEKAKRQQILSVFSLSILILSYLLFAHHREKRQTKNIEKKEAKEFAKSSSIPENTEEEILKRLEEFEKSTLYLEKQLRLAGLAKYLKTNTRYLSIILNEKKNKSFNNYINQLRIEYILDKLNNDPIYLNYKISYLAKESGFASQSSFSSSFKEIAGMPPSTYIKLIINKNSEEK